MVVLGAAALVLAALPWLPSGPDIYVHAAWAHQSMRCLGAGSPPLWLPDMNAGCGSPGIRLYSPAGPFLAGLLGLVAGDALAGLRVLLVSAFVLLAILLRRGGVESWPMGLALTVLATPVLADLFTRSAISELLALPVAWWLLDRAVSREHPDPALPMATLALAALWLLHAPTTVLVVLLLGAAAPCRSWRSTRLWVRAGLAASALTAWHWLPMLREMAMVGGAGALKGGIFAAGSNLLGSPSAHAPALNTALSAAAVALLLVVLVEGWQRTDPLRAALVTLTVGLASPLAAPLWAEGSPLAWLQFPWRWLVPATLLAIRPLAERTPVSNPRSWILGAIWLAPLLLLPVPPVVRAPVLGPGDGWRVAGERLHTALGSNPLLVDATQNRPPWYGDAMRELPLLGGALAVAPATGAILEIREWSPLERSIGATAPRPGPLLLRLLDYPWWQVTVDGRPAAAARNRGLIRVLLPAGAHTIRVRWTGNPLSRLGLALALAGILALLAPRWRSTHRRRPDTMEP